MKTKRKAKWLLTMLLAFVMLVGLLPTTVFAGNPSEKELESITVTGVPMPKAGDKVSDYNEKKFDSVSITTNPTGAVSDYYIAWYNDKGGENIPTETFVAGTTYSYLVAVTMADGYCCTKPTEIDAKLNGKKPRITLFGSTQNGHTYTAFGMINKYTIPVAYTISFDMNGHAAQVDAQKVNKGAKATKPTDPSAEGYNFKGWYADKNLTNEFDFETAIKADTTVYAKWEKKAAKPTKPTKTNPTTGAESPKTDDNSSMALWIALLFASGVGVF